VALAIARGGDELTAKLSFNRWPLTNPLHHDEPDATARLKRGATVLLILFWTLHLVIMLVRAELNHSHGREPFFDSVLRRTSFALMGAVLGYGLYLVLRLLRRRDFLQQAALGAGLALITAIVQGAANAVVFDSGEGRFVASFLYSTMYWFWFYFCWTTAYLAFAYSIEVQEQERRSADLAVRAQEAQVLALRYQINPHFLFNTLNAIAALVRDAPDKAENMVVQLSDFFRRSLAVNPMEDLTLAEEVDLQRVYLEIERTRFPDRLRFDVTLEAGTAEARVPALLLQPLVENAVKHGVARSEGPTCIRIRARLEGDTLEVVVENDAAVSGPPAAGEKVGLRNVGERLRSRYGEEATFESSPIPSGGFRNTVRIPLVR
jgi:two-component system, LytTR family, sensor kinase